MIWTVGASADGLAVVRVSNVSASTNTSVLKNSARVTGLPSAVRFWKLRLRIRASAWPQRIGGFDAFGATRRSGPAADEPLECGARVFHVAVAAGHASSSGLGSSRERRTGKNRDRLIRRAFVAPARVLSVDLPIDVRRHKTRLIELHQPLAICDGTGRSLALRMHCRRANRPRNFHLHRAGGFKIHVSMRPSGQHFEVGADLLLEGLASRLRGKRTLRLVADGPHADIVVCRRLQPRHWRIDDEFTGKNQGTPRSPSFAGRERGAWVWTCHRDARGRSQPISTPFATTVSGLSLPALIVYLPGA